MIQYGFFFLLVCLHANIYCNLPLTHLQGPVCPGSLVSHLWRSRVSPAAGVSVCQALSEQSSHLLWSCGYRNRYTHQRVYKRYGNSTVEIHLWYLNSLFFFFFLLFSVNWCQHWFEYFPNPPLNILSMVENVLAHHDKELLRHFVDCGVTSQVRELTSDLFTGWIFNVSFAVNK